MTTGIKRILAGSRVTDIINRLTPGKVNIMLYHGVRRPGLPSPGESKFIPADVFEAHIRTYIRYGTPVPIESLAQKAPLPANSIVLTFDDGYANNFELAFPILQKYRFPAAFFLTTGFLDKQIPLWTDRLEQLVDSPGAARAIVEWEDAPVRLPRFQEKPARAQLAGELKRRLKLLPMGRIHAYLSQLEERLRRGFDWAGLPAALQPLTWDQARQMCRTGLASFGAHTVSHPILSRCTPGEQRHELFHSKTRLEEELGQECLAFAYPNGTSEDFTSETRRLVREAGYQMALTAEPGYNHSFAPDLYELKRWGPDYDPADLGFLVSGGVRLTQRRPVSSKTGFTGRLEGADCRSGS